MDRDEVVGASPGALRLLSRSLVRAAVQIHDLVELTQSGIIGNPPLNTPRARELTEELATESLLRMRIVANALAGMAKYLDQRANYQDLISSGNATGVEPPQYLGFMPEDPNYLLNLGIGGLQVGGGLAGAAGILAVFPEPVVSKIAAGGLVLYSLFVADAGVRTIMSGGKTVADPYPDQAVEWAALKAGLSRPDAAELKHGFSFAMGTSTMAAPLAGAGMIRPSVIASTAAADGQLGKFGGGELDSLVEGRGSYIGPGRQLQPGNPTDLSLDQVLKLRGKERWQAGEDYWEQVYGGRAQQHHDIPVNSTSNFPVQGSGGRFTDFEASGGGGRTLGGEVKTYLQWRTVDGLPQQTTVPLSDKILEQVNKDVVRRNMERSFDPRWVFTDAPPSPELANYLQNARITYISVHPPVKPK
jgi:hypothetical protein